MPLVFPGHIHTDETGARFRVGVLDNHYDGNTVRDSEHIACRGALQPDGSYNVLPLPRRVFLRNCEGYQGCVFLVAEHDPRFQTTPPTAPTSAPEMSLPSPTELPTVGALTTAAQVQAHGARAYGLALAASRY